MKWILVLIMLIGCTHTQKVKNAKPKDYPNDEQMAHRCILHNMMQGIPNQYAIPFCYCIIDEMNKSWANGINPEEGLMGVIVKKCSEKVGNQQR